LHMIKIHVIIIPTHRINTTIPATQLKLGIWCPFLTEYEIEGEDSYNVQIIIANLIPSLLSLYLIEHGVARDTMETK
jgi:hypothetical protein